MSVLHRSIRKQRSVRSCSKCGCDCSNYQEGCENALNPVLLLPNGLGVPQPGGRKHSVLFSSYDAWNEDNIAQSFREMSPSIGNVLEAAWGGETETLEKLFDDPKTMKMFQNGQLLDLEGRTP